MAKRPETLETVLLALELLRRIPRNRKVTARELHEQLQGAGIERELRSVQRQLEMLCEHFEIERDSREKPYGYRWLEGAKGLSVPMLSEQQSLLLALAEEHLRNLLPVALMKSMESFFAQARTNLGPHTSATREREWLSKVRVVSTTQPLLPPKIRSGVFEEVSNALYANLWLRLHYRNASGQESRPEVMPLGLAQQGPRLYLVCRYHGFDNERSLALHRMVSARSTTISFIRPRSFDLKKYDDDGRFGISKGRKVRLTFRIAREAGQHLLESVLSPDQKVVEIGDEYEISATVVDTAQLQWWLQGFGSKVRLIRTELLSAEGDR